MTFKLDLQCEGEPAWQLKGSRSKVTVQTQTHTDTPNRLLYLGH